MYCQKISISSAWGLLLAYEGRYYYLSAKLLKLRHRKIDELKINERNQLDQLTYFHTLSAKSISSSISRGCYLDIFALAYNRIPVAAFRFLIKTLHMMTEALGAPAGIPPITE